MQELLTFLRTSLPVFNPFSMWLLILYNQAESGSIQEKAGLFYKQSYNQQLTIGGLITLCGMDAHECKNIN